MADDFTGVPTEDLLHLRLDMEFTRLLAIAALTAVVLVVVVLVRAGVLHGWPLLPGHAHG